jgi:pyruvate/2-oxoglutarate dehydrogenase complex dihydrolipoamide dehydrogenase (E3) component
MQDTDQQEYDVIVIGAGSGGLSIAIPMQKFGFRVLLIDKTDHAIGGDCLNDGCVPSKSLIHVARIVHHARQAGQFGLQVGGEVAIEKVTAYIRSRQNIIRKHENASFFRQMGMEVALGKARFVSENQVAVDGQIYQGKNIVIATGSRPSQLHIPGSDKVSYLDNRGIFDIRKLPRQLLIIGGGPIGIEMAQAFRRLGSTVTVVHSKKMILDKEAEEISSILYKRLREEGIHFYLEAKANRFMGTDRLVVETTAGEKELSFDMLLVAIGRELNTEELGLEKAGIEIKEGHIVVDEHLKTTNKHVYVCGDIAGNLQFSHAAEQQATILLNNFLSPLKKKLDNKHMSWVTFTDPEVATFGHNEAHLKEHNISYEKLEMDFSEDDRAVVEDYQYGKLILYIEEKSLLNRNPKLLGGSMIAPNAGELFQELVLANTAGLGIDALFEKIYAYPTASAVNKRIVLHKKEEQLTDLVKKGLHFLYKI